MPERLEALVLRQVDYRDADRMVSLLSADRGRLELCVPQARSSRKRFGGLDLYTLAEFELVERRGRERLSSARVLDSWLGIRDSIERLALAAYACEMLLQAVPEEMPAEQVFLLAKAALSSLESEAADAGLGWVRAFELKLLHVLGARPSLRRCVICGDSGDALARFWSLEQGGLVLGSCADQCPDARPISAGVLRLLDAALHLPLARQAELCWGLSEQREAHALLVPFVHTHIGGRDRARSFLEQLLPVDVLAGEVL